LNAFAQYVAEYIAERREEILRWAVCFTVVLLAHGMVGFVLRESAEAFDYGVDVPVVLLELPDLPPAPVQEQPPEPPPPPEEVPPPEPEPEVVPPEPEPPKPIEEKPVTAPPVVTIPRSLVASWQGRLAAHIERFKRYPVDARERGEQGLARVAFTIDHEGHLLASHIVQSTGSPTLDQETLDMLARAQPMPAPPSGTPDRELSLIVPVRFNIR
jgi:periplasmic protein TonB